MMVFAFPFALIRSELRIELGEAVGLLRLILDILLHGRLLNRIVLKTPARKCPGRSAQRCLSQTLLGVSLAHFEETNDS